MLTKIGKKPKKEGIYVYVGLSQWLSRKESAYSVGAVGDGWV